jgi:hypothetical protein
MWPYVLVIGLLALLLIPALAMAVMRGGKSLR